MKKKGEVSSVFKYIFGIIAGALFLAFFAGFALQQKESSTQLETGRIVFGFDDLLALLSTSEDSSMTYPEQGFPSAVTLNMQGDKISSGKINKPTTKIVFSRNQLKGKQFYLWTKRWKAPYTVDSFFYISDGRVPAYIIYDADSEELAKELTDKFSGFPKTFNIDKYKEAQLDAENLASLKTKAANVLKIRFVILSAKKPNLEGFKNAETVTIKPAQIDGETDWDYGTAEFDDGESTYFGEEMLIGAMLSEDKESYEKTKERAMEKFSIMASIYAEKAELLERKCPGQYTLLANELKSLKTLEPKTKAELSEFVQKTESAKELNRQASESSCPGVF